MHEQPAHTVTTIIAYDSPDINCFPSYGIQFSVDGAAATWKRNKLSYVLPYLQQGPVLNIPDYDGSNAAFTVGPQSAYQTGFYPRGTELEHLTGLNPEAKTIMFGYSGVGYASEWASEFHHSYSPELEVVGAAIGGSPTNITKTYLSVNGGAASALNAWTMLGVMDAFPDFKAYMLDHLLPDMALADKGGTDLVLLKNLLFGGGNKYKSSLLLFAMFLHLLGAAISPVQQIFLSYKTIKRVGYPVSLTQITDFTDLFPDRGPDIGLDATKLRATLALTVNTVVQPRLWSSDNGIVSLQDKSYYTSSAWQTKSQNTLANISTITDPFWAELPTSTNTGLLRQFAPRINSTAIWENNSAATLPEGCQPKHLTPLHQAALDALYKPVSITTAEIIHGAYKIPKPNTLHNCPPGGEDQRHKRLCTSQHTDEVNIENRPRIVDACVQRWTHYLMTGVDDRRC
ncbi:hypothetical protein CNMCM6936_002963 [Aspergillus lentulus]|nr:hypothetical protein CNMCM6936_002963 [Aspergillus lentulus]